MATDSKQEEKDAETTYSIENRTRKRQLSSDSNNAINKPYIHQPPNKKQRVQTQWQNILNGKKSSTTSIQSKKKTKRVSKLPKVTKQKIFRDVEKKFMNIENKKKQILLNSQLQQNADQYETFATMCGFEETEIDTLTEILSCHLSDIAVQSKQIQNIIFTQIPPDYWCRALKQQHNAKSTTILSSQKRLCLSRIHDANLEKKMEQHISTITTTQLDAVRKMCHVKDIMKSPTIKSQMAQMISIDETLNAIKQGTNSFTYKNRLCGSFLKMKQLLNIAQSELSSQITDIELLLIKLKICKIDSNGNRIQLKDKILGGYKLRSTGLLELFEHVITQINDLKLVVKSKQNTLDRIIKDKKLTKIKSNVDKLKDAQRKDRKRKQKRIAKETSGMDVEESDDEAQIDNI